ncbi:MAG: hypothetical protein IKP53_08295 [Candidatus Methanomethylophilaceae archaeon]|nr:hypothetical protein [Candidatus Methanomethylophilaceae archaeon]
MSDFYVSTRLTLSIDHSGSKVELAVVDDRLIPVAAAKLTPKQAERLADEVISRRWEQYETAISRDVTFESSVGGQSVYVRGFRADIAERDEGRFVDALRYHAGRARENSAWGRAPKGGRR